MVGHVNRAPHVYVREDQAVEPVNTPVISTPMVGAEPAAQQLGAPLGEIHGVAEIRDESGNLKGTFTFGGPTGLTREQLEQELGMSIPLAAGGEKQNGGDPNGDGT